MKESQSLARIPDTLVYAMEFIMLPTPGEQSAALDALRKEVLRSHPELKVGASNDSHWSLAVSLSRRIPRNRMAYPNSSPEAQRHTIAKQSIGSRAVAGR